MAPAIFAAARPSRLHPGAEPAGPSRPAHASPKRTQPAVAVQPRLVPGAGVPPGAQVPPNPARIPATSVAGSQAALPASVSS